MPLKINFGCGSSKIPGFLNCDADENLHPDTVVDLLKFPYPFEDATAGLIVLSHTIEHIQARFHEAILLEFNRILVKDGRLVITYPEFIKCAQNYITNHQGKRDFWEATIYGRQLTPWDHHVTAMETTAFKSLLTTCGFYEIIDHPEIDQPFNTVVTAKNGTRLPSYEEAMYKEFYT